MGANTAYTQTAGQMIWSPDKGGTWNNFQNPLSFNSGGSPTSPTSASIFGLTPTNMASATFVMYCPDDGTLGYLASCNRHDNADAYVYLMANDGYWDSGNALYLARVPRAKNEVFECIRLPVLQGRRWLTRRELDCRPGERQSGNLKHREARRAKRTVHSGSEPLSTADVFVPARSCHHGQAFGTQLVACL
jgi:hypothetical protein